MITSIVNIHAGYGPPPKVDAYVDADGFVSLKRSQSSEDATVAVAVAMSGRPEAVLAELDQMRVAVIDAVNAARAAELLAADELADAADAARAMALAYADEPF